MTALPPSNTLTADITDSIEEYKACLRAEYSATTKTDVIYARILGYLILHAPSPTARYEVVKLIRACSKKARMSYQSFFELGKAFLQYFIYPFKKFKEGTPSSSYSSRYDGNNRIGSSGWTKLISRANKSPLQPRNHLEAKRLALIRDSFRCVMTQKWDVAAAIVPSISDDAIISGGGIYYTECCQIVPASSYFEFHPSSNVSFEQADSASSVLRVLRAFGYNPEEFKGANAHAVRNVMTLCKDMHHWFAQLDLWFEPTNVEHCYRIKTSDRFYFTPKQCTFSTPNRSTLPVPSPEYLALHALCAKIAHLSGARAWINELQTKMQGMDVLADDGQSFDVLEYALMKLNRGQS